MDVQQHFNDLELRVRNYAVTVLAAILGLGGYALKEGLQTSILGHPTSVATLILLLSILPWLAFYIMDRLWYHRLLLGAVQHGTFIENRWATLIPEIGLTRAISKGSPVKIGKWQGLHTGTKINICYGLVLLLILLFAFFASHAVHVPAAQPDSPQIGLSDCYFHRPWEHHRSTAGAAFGLEAGGSPLFFCRISPYPRPNPPTTASPSRPLH